jgi:D-sedoheptulose 7-phosphate isomerase
MVGEREFLHSYLQHYAEQAATRSCTELLEMANVIWDAALGGGTVYLFGNGACAALAAHMASDLSKGTAVGSPPVIGTLSLPRVRAVSLSDNTALLTAYGNDVGYEHVYVEQLRASLRPHDVVFALSGSGASPNVLRGLEYAKSVGLPRLGMTGMGSGSVRLISRCTVAMQAPSSEMEHIEDWHVIYSHVLTLLLRARVRTYFEDS